MQSCERYPPRAFLATITPGPNVGIDQQAAVCGRMSTMWRRDQFVLSAYRRTIQHVQHAVQPRKAVLQKCTHACAAHRLAHAPPQPHREQLRPKHADLFEAERQAAVFACRKAKARKQAEAACDGINEAAAAKPFVRGSLDIAALTKPESGGGAAFGVRVNAETKDIPDSVPIALEPDSDIVSGHILANGAPPFARLCIA